MPIARPPTGPDDAGGRGHGGEARDRAGRDAEDRGLRRARHSIAIQVIAAAEAEMWVTAIAIAALPFAARAEPPLNPNQPTQSMPVPVTHMVRLCGGMGVFG